LEAGESPHAVPYLSPSAIKEIASKTSFLDTPLEKRIQQQIPLVLRLEFNRLKKFDRSLTVFDEILGIPLQAKVQDNVPPRQDLASRVRKVFPSQPSDLAGLNTHLQEADKEHGESYFRLSFPINSPMDTLGLFHERTTEIANS